MNISSTTLIIYTAICFIGTFIGLIGVFKKAGFKGWHALIPFYNLYIWLKVLERPMWWFIFLAIPYLSIFMLMLMTWKTIRTFGKTTYPILILGTFFSWLYIPFLGFSAKEKYMQRKALPSVRMGVVKTEYLKNKKEQTIEKTKAREWTDAIIYAVVAAYIIRAFMFELYKIPTSSMEGTLMVGDFLVVSKAAYGPKIPQTIVAFPFVHHTLPLTKYTPSYLEWIKLPYYRFPGRTQIKRNDAVVFNYPDGDTVILERQSESYYAVVRTMEKVFQQPNEYAGRYYMSDDGLHQYHELILKYGAEYYLGKGRDVVWKEYNVIARPIDKRENYIKRCVGIAGDKLEIKNTVLYINDKIAYIPEKLQHSYRVYNNGVGLNNTIRQKLNINEEDFQEGIGVDYACLYKSQLQQIEGFRNITYIEPLIDTIGSCDSDIMPHDPRYCWNKDNFGPILIPKAGSTVTLNDSTLQLYKRIICIYENNELEQRNGKIYINGKEASSYTFKMNYYWMMGDNRHNSADSRYWGFVPEDHIVGKTAFVWLSLDKFKSFGDGKIRWNRIFRKIR